MSNCKNGEKSDALGDRMKRYEIVNNNQLLIPNLPIYGRIDGRHFSNFTRGFGYPFYDEEIKNKHSTMFANAMRNAACDLAREFHFDIVETHSDEVSFCYADYKHVPFNGKYFKLISNIGSFFTAAFANYIYKFIPDYLSKGKYPSFDCRLYQVPNLMELVNCFVWRQQDCIRGSINQYAQLHFSHKQLNGKSQSERLEMLNSKGFPWENQGNENKYGFWIKPKNVEMGIVNPITGNSEIVQRTKYEKLDVSFSIGEEIENKVDFFFERNCNPIFKTTTKESC